MFVIQFGGCTKIQLQQFEKIVSNLHDNMLLAINKNAQYKKIVKDLIEKFHDQERSIRQIQEKCQLHVHVVKPHFQETPTTPALKRIRLLSREWISILHQLWMNLHKINKRFGPEAANDDG